MSDWGAALKSTLSGAQSGAASAVSEAATILQGGFQKVESGVTTAYGAATALAKHTTAEIILGSEEEIVTGARRGGQIAADIQHSVNPIVDRATKAYQRVKHIFLPAQPVTIPCVPCLAGC